MRRLRITGIVRTADHVRKALSQPLTARQRDALSSRLNESLRAIDAILDRNGATIRHLPPPSQRAYQFLKQVDLRAVPTVAEPPVEPRGSPAGGPAAALPESVGFRGLPGFLDRLLDNIALGVITGRLHRDKMLEVVANTRQRLDRFLIQQTLDVSRLTPQAGQLLGWFRWFAQAEAFDDYLRAVRAAQAILGAIPADRVRWKPPLLVHYRPSRPTYRWRAARNGTRVVLNTATVSFEEPELQSLAGLVAGDRGCRRAVMAAMLAEPYQRMAVELEEIVGSAERTRGMAHDLSQAFDRVSRRYFAGQMPRPKLRWSRSLTGRVFGHYEFVGDTVCISSTLDRPDVPAFVLDYVVFHELLHKKHGIRWRGHRQHVHTPQFQAEERTFEPYDRASAFLKTLTR